MILYNLTPLLQIIDRFDMNETFPYGNYQYNFLIEFPYKQYMQWFKVSKTTNKWNSQQ